MRKYGGPGTLKQPCAQRRCVGEVAQSPRNNGAQGKSTSRLPNKPPTSKGSGGGSSLTFESLSSSGAGALGGFTNLPSSSASDALLFRGIVNEGEVFAPFDPAVSARELDRVATQTIPGPDTFSAEYDASFTAFLDGRSAEACRALSARSGGNATSRYEAMLFGAPPAPKTTNLNPDVKKHRPVAAAAGGRRQVLLEALAKEPGLRAMDMLPLPVWVRGSAVTRGGGGGGGGGEASRHPADDTVNTPGNFLTGGAPQLLEAVLQAAASSSSSSTSSNGNGTKGGSKSGGGGQVDDGFDTPYGEHFPPPEPYRNEDGHLIVILHKSRLQGSVLPFGTVLSDRAPTPPPRDSEAMQDGDDDEEGASDAEGGGGVGGCEVAGPDDGGRGVVEGEEEGRPAAAVAVQEEAGEGGGDVGGQGEKKEDEEQEDDGEIANLAGTDAREEDAALSDERAGEAAAEADAMTRGLKRKASDQEEGEGGV